LTQIGLLLAVPVDAAMLAHAVREDGRIAEARLIHSFCSQGCG